MGCGYVEAHGAEDWDAVLRIELYSPLLLPLKVLLPKDLEEEVVNHLLIVLLPVIYPSVILLYAAHHHIEVVQVLLLLVVDEVDGGHEPVRVDTHPVVRVLWAHEREKVLGVQPEHRGHELVV
jgi:hypothetical protein